MLDQDVIDQLVRDVGDETAKELIALFIDEARQRVRRIGALTGTEDCEKLAREAHALKSTSMTYGAAELGRLAKDLEATSRAGTTDRSLIDKVARSAERDLAALEAFLAEF